jgi:hypothetical protein
MSKVIKSRRSRLTFTGEPARGTRYSQFLVGKHHHNIPFRTARHRWRTILKLRKRL